MKTLALGMPPIGAVAHISESPSAIPEPFRTKAFADFEARYPGVYILAAYDDPSQLFAMLTRTRQVWISAEIIRAVIIFPTLPAKGSGDIEIAFETDRCPHRGMLWVPGYSEVAHRWIKEKATQLATLLNCPVRERAPAYDA